MRACIQSASLLVVLAACCAAGCRSLWMEPEVPANTTVSAPDRFQVYGERVAAEDRWWRSFQSPSLNRLVRDALGANESLAQARARLTQANALAAQAAARRWPTLDFHTSTAVGRRSGAVQGTEGFERYSADLVAGYEVDVWGRLHANQLVADLSAGAAAMDLQTVALTLTAEVTLRWLELLQQRQILDLLDEQVATNRKVLDLIELRFRRGQATALDVLQQREVVARVQALIPPEKAREETVSHELAVLLGRAPRMLSIPDADEMPALPSLPRIGLPAEVLQDRPDVRAARLRLSGSGWQVAAAKADRLPALRLSGSGVLEANELDAVLDNWVASLAASVSGPIFDAGRRRAEVERVRAVARERLHAYRQTVLTALQDVEGALVRERRQSEFIERLERQLEIAGQTRDEAESRYRRGLESYLPVLTALNNVQRLQRQLVQARYRRLTFRVALHRAVGGDWVERAHGPAGAE